MANTMELYNGLMRLRDAERTRVAASNMLVDGEKAPQELTPFGYLTWYTHPLLDEPALKTYLLFVQEIPAGSRSGRLRHQGGRVHYVWSGSGYTVVDGTRYEWEAGDAVCIPIKPDGVEFQHFNTGLDPVRLVSAEPNMVGTMGVDIGVRTEVLEFAPEYRG